jgi:hypothetical protein
MQKDALQRGLSIPDEACARHHCLRKGVEAPDLATVKDCFAFISLRATAESWRNPRSIRLKSLLNVFLPAFTRITGTPTNEEDRNEVYSISASP